MPDLRKAAAVIIKDRKLLVFKGSGKDTFVSPGGKLEANETVEVALVRELSEEVGVKVDPENLEPFGSFSAEAATNPGRQVTIEVFFVKSYAGEIRAAEIGSEIAWLNSKIPPNIKVGSIFEHEVIPRLKRQNLLD